MSRFSTKARYTRAIIPTVILFLLSLAADLVILFTLGRSMITPDTFHGAFAIYLLAISLPIGVAFGFLTCFATRHSGDARDHAKILAFVRAVLIWIVCLAGTFINDNWVGEAVDRGEAQGGIFAYILFIGALLLAGQAFVVFGTLFIKEPPYIAQSVPSSSSSASSSSSSSSSSSVGSSRSGVEDTQWYKNKVEDYYDQYMGRPPRERKPTWSDEEIKKFSDIVDNQ